MATYTISDPGRELRQSEIISNLIQYSYTPESGEVIETPHTFAIVLTQDCDLLRDYEARKDNKAPVLNGVLLFELLPVDVIRPKLPGGDIFRRIKRHSEDRYHYLEAVPKEQDLIGQGLSDAIIDFRRYYTISAPEIYRQCQLAEGAKRRCQLNIPYREHLQNRAAFYLQRVALPDPDLPPPPAALPPPQRG